MRRHFYFPSHDGTELAVTLHLPDAAYHRRVPTILRQTRYFRGVRLAPTAARLGADPFDDYALIRPRFLDAGIAWVDLDVRGSGASFGHRICPWSPDEVDDAVRLVDWIVEQPWSSGRVGGLGTSYDGTASELLASRQHPAVVAIAPRFALFDVYEDIAFPGGIHLTWFTEMWGRINRAFDEDDFSKVAAIAGQIVLSAMVTKERAEGRTAFTRLYERLQADAARRGFEKLLGVFAKGVEPVDPARLAGAVAQHAENYDVHAVALATPFRDDISALDPFGPVAGDEAGVLGSIDRFSPHAVAAKTRASGAAVFSYSGWFDAGYGRAATKRHRALDGAHLLLGPWEHCGRLDFGDRPTAYDHAGELLAFFSRHLLDADLEPPPRVRWFVTGANTWRRGDTWPPPAETRALHLRRDRTLGDAPSESTLPLTLSPNATTGEASRWRSLIGPHRFIGYPERRAQHREAEVFSSAPLDGPLEITGHPLVWLELVGPVDDAQVFVYLDHVAPDGRVTYLSEGMLRLSHRKHRAVAMVVDRDHLRGDARPLADAELVPIDLLPMSAAVPAGHRIVVAITGADRDSFAPPDAPVRLGLRLGESRVEVPVVTTPQG